MEGVYDLRLFSVTGTERLAVRLHWADGVPVPPAWAGCSLYPTKGGHVSLRKTGTSA